MPEAQSSYYSQLFTEGLKGLENETLGPKNGLLWRLLPWEARMGRVLLLSDSWSGKKIGVSGPAAAIQAGGGGGEGRFPGDLQARPGKYRLRWEGRK